MIWLLFFTILLMAIVSYLGMGFDLCSPSFVLCVSYILSVSAAIINIQSWHIDYHVNSYLVIIAGIFCFIVVEWIICSIYHPSHSILTRQGLYESSRASKTHENLKNVGRNKIFIGIIFQTVTMVLYIREVYRISLIAGNHGKYTTMMSYYNYAVNYLSLNSAQSMDFIVTQMYSISLSIAYISFFAFIYNFVYSKRVNSLYLVSPIIFMLNSVFTGSRSGITNFIIFSLVIFYIIHYRKNGMHHRNNMKYVLRVLVIGCAFLLLFVGIKQLVGRTDITSPIDYITGYMGGSIQLFDIYMQQSHDASNYRIGSETFFAIYKFLSKKGIFDTTVFRNLPFVSLSGTSYNVYTAFRRYIDDFGIIGAMILQAVFSGFYSTYYYYIKNHLNRLRSDFSIILYGMIFFPIVFHAFDDMFFSSLLSFGFILQIVYTFAVFHFFGLNKNFQKQTDIVPHHVSC